MSTSEYPASVFTPMVPVESLREPKLSVKQVRQILGVSPMQVYRLLHEGEIRHYRVGNRFVIPVTAVREYLARVAS